MSHATATGANAAVVDDFWPSLSARSKRKALHAWGDQRSTFTVGLFVDRRSSPLFLQDSYGDTEARRSASTSRLAVDHASTENCQPPGPAQKLTLETAVGLCDVWVISDSSRLGCVSLARAAAAPLAGARRGTPGRRATGSPAISAVGSTAPHFWPGRAGRRRRPRAPGRRARPWRANW